MIKKALVTGSAVGIGKAIALDLASQGFDIAFHYRNSAEAAQKASQEAAGYGVKSVALQADITQVEQANSLVENTVAELGGLSVLVNNVGNYIEKPLDATSFDEWHYLLDSNLNNTAYVTHSALPYLKAAGWGRIINFAFASAQYTIADDAQPAYRVAKTALISYSKSLAKEVINDNITVNIISPGVAENSVDIEPAIQLLPKKRPASLKEICYAVNFFINPQADYITGQVLEVAGGWRL
ncbi:MAG: bifunctional dihydropteridine reductase/dihydrofolate reductase TmpR [Cyanothece sp. SIO2G6]|nr:bifunctional dihydropteridine reductase/dihydrofolate reductase TmpR [Cyanothece sp. SIO2G6]